MARDPEDVRRPAASVVMTGTLGAVGGGAVGVVGGLVIGRIVGRNRREVKRLYLEMLTAPAPRPPGRGARLLSRILGRPRPQRTSGRRASLSIRLPFGTRG